MSSHDRDRLIYYSSTGNVHALAQALAQGAEQAGADVRLRRVAELAPQEAINANAAWRAHADATAAVPVASVEDLRWADGYAFGSPTRFGNVAAQLKQFLDLSIVNVALPAIDRDVGFSPGTLQWVVNGYALAFGGLLLLGGRAADLFGGRRVFLAALSVFTGASLACGLATGPGMLVAARAVQGLSAGAMSPATLSILTSTFRRSEQRNRALSVWTAVAIGGDAVGALLGGVLTGGLTWRWIFLVNVPIGVLLLALAPARVPHAAAKERQGRLDVAGAVTVTGGLTALVWALVRSESAGWASTQVIGGLTAAAALLGAFVVIETRVAAVPLLPFSVFGSRLVAAGNLTSFLSFAPVLATWFFLTLYLQGVRGYAPVPTGLIFLPMSLAVVGGSQLSFRVASRVDPRKLFATGGVVAAAGLAWLGRLSPATHLAWVIMPACIAMIGGLMFAPSTVAATAGVDPDQDGLASGLLNTTRQIGGALGLAVLSSIAAISANRPGRPFAQAATSGYGTAFTVGAAIFLATALIGAIALPRRLSRPVDDGPDTPATRHQTSHASSAPSGPSKPPFLEVRGRVD